MQEFSRPLGDAVKKARCRLQLTQNEIAEIIDVDPRTILNIENYRGNPKMEVLYPLIRALNIDARSIFNSDIIIESPSISQLRMIIESCTEQEAESIIPIITAVVSALRATERTVIE